jgi:hypothetical protein
VSHWVTGGVNFALESAKWTDFVLREAGWTHRWIDGGRHIASRPPYGHGNGMNRIKESKATLFMYVSVTWR